MHGVQAQVRGQRLGLGSPVAGNHDQLLDAQRAQPLQGVVGIGAQGVAQRDDADRTALRSVLTGATDVEQRLAFLLETADDGLVLGERDAMVFLEEMAAADDHLLTVYIGG